MDIVLIDGIHLTLKTWIILWSEIWLHFAISVLQIFRIWIYFAKNTIHCLQLNIVKLYVTFQGNSEIWSHKTGGRLIQVSFYEMHCEGKQN